VPAATLSVVPYDPTWPERFDTERALLDRILEPWLEGGIHHIGSTAVPGLAATPIVDMMAGVRDLEAARDAYAPLLEASYHSTPHRPGIAHHFSKPSPELETATHGLHLTEPGSDLWRERLAFRDALRANASLAEDYEALKLRLAAEHGAGVGEYTAEKRPFVARVLGRQGIPLGVR
jgi:GrpB-like predicted nucleotidyltransferase (UPF0157 family)